MKSDGQLQQDVMEELKWDASVAHHAIGVSVNDGVVELDGTVPSHADKGRAEKAAFRVTGVRAVVDHLKVKLLPAYERGDDDIARAAINVLLWNTLVPEGIKVLVNDGVITLQGSASWKYQKDAAYNSVKALMGVRSVINLIKLVQPEAHEGLKLKIRNAIQRARLNPGEIKVDLEGSTVTLKGKVTSYAERDAAEAAAWSAPGITQVKDDISVVL